MMTIINLFFFLSRNLSYKHLAQMKYIFSEALQIEKIIIHDKKTLCMQPHMKITLQFDVVAGHGEVSDIVALRQAFSLRLYNFFMLHPEVLCLNVNTVPC